MTSRLWLSPKNQIEWGAVEETTIIKNTETDANDYRQLVFDKGARVIQQGRDNLLNNVLQQLDI